MINAIFRPVEKWPGDKTPSYRRKNAPFRCTQTKRLDLLEVELEHLSARDIVVQAYLSLDAIRNDGWPRSGVKPSDPGVILSFLNLKKELFSYPCDTYRDWNDNLYAIAKSLEALRAVDRYGVTRGSEQYQGFKRIEAAPSINPKTLAEAFICQHAGVRLDDLRNDLSGAYKIAAVGMQLDRVGHDELLKQLQEHLRVLRTN